MRDSTRLDSWAQFGAPDYNLPKVWLSPRPSAKLVCRRDINLIALSLKIPYDEGMPKRSSKPTDLNKRAAAIVAQSIDPDNQEDDPYQGKNPAAVELGRLGGLKGGKARAAKLSPEERSAIARKAAQVRWSTDRK
jgi:hypothetical protein